VATLQERQLLIQVWYDYTLNDASLGLWAGFGASDYNRKRVEALLTDCAAAFPSHQTVRSYDELRGIPLDDVLAGPIAEFCPRGYNGFGIYGHPGVDVLDVHGAVNFIEQVLVCLPEDREQDLQEIRCRQIPATTKKRLIDARCGQGLFREDLEHIWGNKCAVLGCETREVLRASHIKPWRNSTDEERLDPNNGLLLAAHLDALFDRGLISFRDDGSMMVSSRIAEADRNQLNLCNLQIIRPKKISATMKIYLAYHRDKTFKQPEVRCTPGP